MCSLLTHHFVSDENIHDPASIKKPILDDILCVCDFVLKRFGSIYLLTFIRCVVMVIEKGQEKKLTGSRIIGL